MSRTKWSNPHGLSNPENKSTIEDMCLLCHAVMENQYLRKVVSTKNYSCKVEPYTGGAGEGRTLSWENTNRMLWKGWSGIKTGVTPNAGPCLAASLATGGHEFLVVIANCSSMEQRWGEVQVIVEWAAHKFQLMN
jgi:D-alanyl-D-alanine carboxypeptidase